MGTSEGAEGGGSGAGGTTIRWAGSEAEIRAAQRLREEVFCREQGVPLAEELDGLDGQAGHLLAVPSGQREVIGTLRLLISGGEAKIGRVAVARSWRRRGVAAAMLALALERAAALGCVRARLAAQLDAIALYEQADFAVESDVFVEAGIDHVWMGRGL